MGFFDWLFGDTDPEPQTTTQTQQAPQWLQDMAQGLLQRGDTLSQQPYQAYPGPRIAPLTGDQLTSMQQVRDRGFAGGLRTLDAYNQAQGSARDLTQADVDRYMNPYMWNVADTVSREMDLRNEQQRNTDSYRAGIAGAFGGARHGIVDVERERSHEQGQSDLYYRAQADAYNQAINQFNQQRGQELSSASEMGRLSAAEQGQFYQDTAARYGIGQLQQGETERNYGLAYQDFLNQQQYPYQQLGFMGNLMQGIPSATTGSTTTTTTPGQPSPGIFQQAAGLGLAALGLWG